MKQPIAGIAPPELEEVTVMQHWPSISAYPLGRTLGKLFDIRWPEIYFFRLGRLIALLSIPLALGLYFFRLVPSICGLPIHGGFYLLTNRRVQQLRMELNFKAAILPFDFKFGAENKSIALDRFDSIVIDQRPGQEWFDAGDLIFRREGVEVFRLAGVSRPEAFRTTCMNSHRSYVGVKNALELEAAHA